MGFSTWQEGLYVMIWLQSVVCPARTDLGGVSGGQTLASRDLDFRKSGRGVTFTHKLLASR